MIWLIAKKELYDNWQSHKITKEIEERYAVLRRKRLTLSQILTRFSPVGAYVYAATGLAQTSIEDEKRYHSQLEGHQSQLSANIKETLMKAKKPEELPPIYTQRPPEEPHAYRDWKLKINRYEMGFIVKNLFASQLNFTFEKLSLSETLRAILLDLLLLALWMGLGFAFAMLALVKCEVQ